jgi:hypothetical protein
MAEGTPTPPEPPAGLGPGQPPGQPPPATILNRRVIAAASLVVVLLVAVLSSGQTRQDASRFIRDEIQAPVAKVAPFDVAGYFLDSLRDCGDYAFPACRKPFPDWVPRIPVAIIDTAGHVADQGLVAVLLIGLPVLFFFVVLVGAIAGGDTPWLLLAPPYWAALVMLPALFVWIVQLLVLALIFLVEQTILAVGILAAFFYVYEKLELWQKITTHLHTLFAGRSAG